MDKDIKKNLVGQPIFDEGRKYKFTTNNWEITNEEVALIYKNRWIIETCFKSLKQNFQLTYFYSEYAFDKPFGSDMGGN